MRMFLMHAEMAFVRLPLVLLLRHPRHVPFRSSSSRSRVPYVLPRPLVCLRILPFSWLRVYVRSFVVFVAMVDVVFLGSTRLLAHQRRWFSHRSGWMAPTDGVQHAMNPGSKGRKEGTVEGTPFVEKGRKKTSLHGSRDGAPRVRRNADEEAERKRKERRRRRG